MSVWLNQSIPLNHFILYHDFIFFSPANSLVNIKGEVYALKSAVEDLECISLMVAEFHGALFLNIIEVRFGLKSKQNRIAVTCCLLVIDARICALVP